MTTLTAILNVAPGSAYSHLNGQSFEVVDFIGQRKTLKINNISTDFYGDEAKIVPVRNLDYIEVRVLKYLFTSGRLPAGVVGKSLCRKGWAKPCWQSRDFIEPAVLETEFFDENGAVREEFALVEHYADEFLTETA